MNKIAFVAGSAHLDILSRVTGDDLPVDKIGEVSIEIGGTGFNIAVNLQKMGVQTRFMTAMNRSAYSAIVSEHLAACGLDAFVEYHDGLPIAAFCGQIDHDGELMTAVSSMPVDRYAFTENLVMEAMHGASCAIAECNLASSNLDTIVTVANRLMIPVYIAAVSAEKSLRIKGVNGKIDGLFLNKLEMSYMRAHLTPLARTLPEMAQMLGTVMVVTRDVEGVEIASGAGNHTEKVSAPRITDEKGHFLGAGDAFLSATLYGHVFEGLSLAAAANSAIGTVEHLIRHGNCNLGEEKAVERILKRANNKTSPDNASDIFSRADMEQLLAGITMRCQAQGGQLSAALVGIDLFKSISDIYGHQAAETLASAVAGIILAEVGNDGLVARWSESEFFCVFPGEESGAGSARAESIRQKVKSGVTVPKPVTASIGVAEFQLDVDDRKSLVSKATKALYSARQNGRNSVAVAQNTLLLSGKMNVV